MRHITSLLAVAEDYDAFLIDLWGVVHDGETLYPGAREALAGLREAGKRIIFLSNAPRRAHKAAERLAALGVGHELYDHVVTSGEAVYAHLAEGWKGGRRYFYLGPDRDADLPEGLPYRRSGLMQCDFLLCAGFIDDSDPPAAYDATLRAAQALGRPMLCANPDRVVVRRSGERLPCAGLLAEAYEKLGGRVLWFGKPHREVYLHCLRRLEGVAKDRILAVGDNFDTDMLGARDAGLAAAFVAGGVFKEALYAGGSLDAALLTRLAAEHGVSPAYCLPSLGGSA